MRFDNFHFIILLVFASGLFSCQCDLEIKYADKIENTRNPRIAYWFFTPDLLVGNKYLTDIESISTNSPYDLLFISARGGCDFYDVKTMNPVFEKLVQKAHQRGLKIGLQLWNTSEKVVEENCQRTLTEGEIQLDNYGNGTFRAKASHIRPKNFYKNADLICYRTDIYRAFAFRKMGEGVYDPSTLKDITVFCNVVKNNAGESAKISIQGGKSLAGYTVYLMAEHFYNHPDMYSAASQSFTDILSAYKDIPFDGTALDEFGYMRITPPREMKQNEFFSVRFFSPAMGKAMEEADHSPAEITLFHMRYAPGDSFQVRSAAINLYMKILRDGPLKVENEFYTTSKELFGEKCFIGVHNTFHNTLVDDEMWVTGINWWQIRRDYGQTDENSSLPVQLGVAFSNRESVLYNMFYHPNPDTICLKAINDLRFGIRTHYHAFNDKQWGVGLESPVFLKKVKPVEDAAALLNRFNAALPDTRLLVIFGLESLANWYPDYSGRSSYNLNNKLNIEEKSLALLKAGYMNALVPSDLIENGKIVLNEQNKVVLNNHVFDAVVFLNPQYAREKTLQFLEKYTSQGGRLMLEGTASLGFSGGNIAERIEKIREKATVDGFNIQQIGKLEIEKNIISGGCYTADKGVILTDYFSVINHKTCSFEVELEGEKYSGKYRGMLAFQSDDGRIFRLTSTGLLELKRNGNPILTFNEPQSLFVEKTGNNKMQMTLYDPKKQLKPKLCKL